MKTLTISIPAYNVDRYLSTCLEHITKARNISKIEVLVINDGSTDKTGDIADNFAAMCPGSIRHVSKKNGGHGSALMAGIANATGKYFYNIDGDDDVDITDLDNLVDVLVGSNEDCILVDYKCLNNNSGAITEVKNMLGHKYAGIVCTFSEICNYATLRMPTMVIKTQVLKSGDLSIDEHRYFTDKEYIFYSLPLIKNYVYYELQIYVYRIEQATQSMSLLGTRKHNPDREFVSLQLALFFEKNKESFYPELRKYLRTNIAISYVGTVNGYLQFKWTDHSVRKILLQYDIKFKETSNEIYEQVYSENSLRIHKLKALRAFRFFGWKLFALVAGIRR